MILFFTIYSYQQFQFLRLQYSQPYLNWTMDEKQSTNLQPPHPLPQKHVSFQTEQSVLTGSTRKKYYLKKNKYSQQKLNQLVSLNGSSKSNIFDLTADYSHSFSEISNSDCHTVNSSLTYQNSLFNSQCKESSIENPEKKIILPIITESKYNFRPSIALAKVVKRQYHQKAPKYIQNEAYKDSRNIYKMKKYQQLWAEESQLRLDKSLMERSIEKAEKYIEKHNLDVYRRKGTIQFETILRDRHIKQENRIGLYKSVPNRSLPGLKGKGGSVSSLYEQMYAIEQVYKIDK